MKFRPLHLLPLLSPALAWSCGSVSLDGRTYDLSPLKGTHTASKKTDTPPTTNEALVRFDVCGTIERKGEDEDQCPEGTLACLTLINHKDSAKPKERVTAVIPMWKGEDPEIARVDGALRLSTKGGDFAGLAQTFELTLKCAEAEAEPVLESYTAGTLKLEWKTPTACTKDEPAPPPGDGGGEPAPAPAAGWGFFGFINFVFWTFFFVLLAYFVIGIAYNHQQYSARGWDLVPHRDFWRELPALARDLGGHLVSNVRQSTGRGGYSSLG